MVVRDGSMNNFDRDTALKMISDISQRGRNYTPDQIIISVRKKNRKVSATQYVDVILIY